MDAEQTTSGLRVQTPITASLPPSTEKVLRLALCIIGLSLGSTKLVDNLVRLSADGKGIYFNDRPSEIIFLSRVQPSADGHRWRSIDDGDEEKLARPQ
jgi:hypothetical protein